MKTFIVLAALVAVALADVSHLKYKSGAAPQGRFFVPASNRGQVAAPAVQKRFVAPVSSRQFAAPTSGSDVHVVNEVPSNNLGLDGYKFAYELSDGQKREESAQVEARANPEESAIRVTGSFSFVGQDGQTYTVSYVADENGFQPQGAHLPVAPVA